ncbi:MAG: flagellar basal body P-ring protein FlgI [Thermoguttaceae bacterium]|nr:flagellar basal body P-ring protein FlgI [Thermoguttaceae bacterium]
MSSRVQCIAFGAVVLAAGCCSWDKLSFRSQSPDQNEPQAYSARLVRDMAVPYNMTPVRIEAIGLVTGLRGTGSDPAPSPQRAVLLNDMQGRGVKDPNYVLQSPSTSLVLVRGVLRPGIQKGDRFDIELRIPAASETTSLRGGRLMECRMRELAVLGGRIHEGHVLGLAQGPILVDPSAEAGVDKVIAARGRVLGGGVALKSRPLGLALKPEHQSVFNSSRIATAINRRFHTFDRGVKVGVADAQTDKIIRLHVHPRYKDHIDRYVRVVRAVVVRETARERAERIAQLKGQLLDPATAAEAAIQLEAIGVEGVDALMAGIESGDREVRFHAAESLAYLDRREAAQPLAEAARNEPAFRVFALSALSVIEDFAAYDALRDMLASQSAETRYGAFRSLWVMNRNDPLVCGEQLSEFSYHVLDVGGPPMIHVTRNRRPELVVFGSDQRLNTPLVLNAGNRILITSLPTGEVSVARFSVGESDQKRIVSAKIDDVIRAIVELGGTYPDVVQALQEAKQSGTLQGRFAIEALPEAGRRYQRGSGDEVVDQAPQDAVSGDDLFAEIDARDASIRARSDPDAASDDGAVLQEEETDDDGEPRKGFLGRMFSWR